MREKNVTKNFLSCNKKTGKQINEHSNSYKQLEPTVSKNYASFHLQPLCMILKSFDLHTGNASFERIYDSYIDWNLSNHSCITVTIKVTALVQLLCLDVSLHWAVT